MFLKQMVLGLGLAFLLSSCGRKEKLQKIVPTVRIERVLEADAEGLLQYPGRVVSSKEAKLSFRVSGQLRRLYVSEGEHVRAGQLIAELDDSDYKIQLSATQAEYAQIKADADRVMALYSEGNTTASNYDKARYGLEQITAKLDNHKKQLSYTRLYAPCAGYVQKQFFEPNEMVGAGIPIVGLLGDGALEVEISLPARMYVHRQAMRSFECTLDVLPGEVFPLRLISVLPNANSNRLYTMRLGLAEGEHRISPGMSAWVKVRTVGLADMCVIVPSTALLHRGGRTYVFVYDGNSQRVYRKNVVVSCLHNDGTAEVSGELCANDMVVSTGVHHIVDGQRVDLLQGVSKTNVGGLL